MGSRHAGELEFSATANYREGGMGSVWGPVHDVFRNKSRFVPSFNALVAMLYATCVGFGGAI